MALPILAIAGVMYVAPWVVLLGIETHDFIRSAMHLGVRDKAYHLHELTETEIRQVEENAQLLQKNFDEFKKYYQAKLHSLLQIKDSHADLCCQRITTLFNDIANWKNQNQSQYEEIRQHDRNQKVSKTKKAFNGY